MRNFAEFANSVGVRARASLQFAGDGRHLRVLPTIKVRSET